MYDIYISAGFEPKSNEETAKVELMFNNDRTSVLKSELIDEAGSHVNIIRLGTVALNEGKNTVKITNTSTAKPADVDAVILYPVRTYAVYKTNSGEATKIARDNISSTLVTGKPQDVDSMDKITFSIGKTFVKHGERIYINGTVTNADKPVKNQMVVMTIDGKQYLAKTDAKGRFTRNFRVPSDFKPGICKVAVRSGSGEANLYFKLVSQDKK